MLVVWYSKTQSSLAWKTKGGGLGQKVADAVQERRCVVSLTRQAYAQTNIPRYTHTTKRKALSTSQLQFRQRLVAKTRHRPQRRHQQSLARRVQRAP